MGGSTRQRGGTGSSGRVPPLSISLPVDPEALSRARAAVADWLGGAGVGRRDVDDVLIAMNEACINAIEHSGTPPEAGVQVVGRLEGERLRMEVCDSGRWREPTPRRDRGHGLGLMRELSDTLEIACEDSGTTVVMRTTLSFGDD